MKSKIKFLPVLLFTLFLGVGVRADEPRSLDTRDLVTERWSFTSGSEFPGAAGGLDVAGEAGARRLILRGDFTAGGRYVGMTFAFSEPCVLEQLRVRLKADVRSVALRITDSTGQTFQQYVPLEPGNSDVQELVVTEFSNPSRKGIYFWGGAKDGVWRGSIQSIMILLNAPDKPGAHSFDISAIEAKTRPLR